MKALAYALTLYCLAAIIAIIAAAVHIGLELAGVQAARPAAAAAAEHSREAQRTANREYSELAERQRTERANYSGADAIKMSYRVQQARDAFHDASTQAREAAERLAELERRIEKQQVLYVPLGGLLLLHAIGLLVFWPWRERKTPKPAR